MSKRDLSPVSENEKRRPLQQRKSISDEMGPMLEQKIDIDPQIDGNLASRQIEANSRQNSTETSRYSIGDADGFVLEESESDTALEDLIAVGGTLQHVQGTRAEGDGPPISGEDSADSGTAKINTTKIKRQSSHKEYVVTSGLECKSKVEIPSRLQQQNLEVVWIRHSKSGRIMKITNTDVTMVESSNHECNLNRITFQSCTEEAPAFPGLSHVVFKKATTEKTLAITQDPAQDLQNDNSRTVGVGDASGLDKPVKPEEDLRFFRLRYPGSTGDGEPVLLELCKHHGKFLAYEGERLQVLPLGVDLAPAGNPDVYAKFRFQIIDKPTTPARQQMT